jgi:hypothetical protein
LDQKHLFFLKYSIKCEICKQITNKIRQFLLYIYYLLFEYKKFKINSKICFHNFIMQLSNEDYSIQSLGYVKYFINKLGKIHWLL